MANRRKAKAGKGAGPGKKPNARQPQRKNPAGGKNPASDKDPVSGKEQGGGKEAGPGGSFLSRATGVVPWLWSFETTRLIVLVVAMVVILRTFLIQTFVITSGSMESTLLTGDFLVVNRAAVGSRVPFTDIRIPGYSQVKRGDILVFDPHHEENMTVVKRLVGLPGDTLEMRNKALYLNGAPQDEPYVVTTTSAGGFSPDFLWQMEHLVGGPRTDYHPTRDNWGPIVVPEGRYFMLGDNRDTSLDSRFWGFLEAWRFEGRAVAIYFSYNRGSFRPFPWIREIRASRIGTRVR